MYLLNNIGIAIEGLRKNLVLVLLIGLLFAACKSKVNKQVKKESDLQRIIKKGKIVALTGYNAYSYFIYKGQPMGYEYSLLKLFGKYLNVNVEIKVVPSLSEMFRKLRSGQGDLIAFNLTVTNERRKLVAFTHYLNTTKQVLVQRLPKNWRLMTRDDIEKSLIRSPLELDGKTIYVLAHSSYVTRLENLSEEIGGKINIVEADSNLSTEDLIELVAQGKIDYTVSDENVARLSQAYLPNIDVNTPISFPQKIAWAVRKSSKKLLDTLNVWIDKMKRKTIFYVLYNKYYKNRIAYARRRRSVYFTSVSGKISKYDSLIKKYSKWIGWDWRLAASLIYQESQFNPQAKSWAGAVGLMQLMPETAASFGAKDPLDPYQSLKAGFKYLKWLNKFWNRHIKDENERIKFVLASYNIGPGHILDAMRLAGKYGADSTVWFGNVEKFLRLKSRRKYFTDPVVRYGYSDGRETIKYVREILERYYHYKQLITSAFIPERFKN